MALAKCILSSGFVRLWFNAEMFFFICAKQKSWSLGSILHFNFIVCDAHDCRCTGGCHSTCVKGQGTAFGSWFFLPLRLLGTELRQAL